MTLSDMSALHVGDDHLHHCDSSHRWVAPPHLDQASWNASMRIHLELHRATMGGPVADERRAVCVTARVPRQRTPMIHRPA